MMEINVGKNDKIVRIVLGLAALYFAYPYNWLWYVIAGVLFFTAYTGFCGLYKVLKINTAK